MTGPTIRPMRIALAQLNPIVGDVMGNTALVLDAMEQAKRDGAEALLTSELVLIGYPPRDLLQREGVVEACEAAVDLIARKAGELFVIVGHPRRVAGGTRPFRNSAAVCHRGKVVAVCDKQLLPGYDVFDEDRYFEPGDQSCSVMIGGRRVGILICEDLWRAKDVSAERRYPVEPIAELAAQKCKIVLSLNASPFVLGKWQRHVEQLSQVARDFQMPVVAVNQVGANDDLIFDGRSVVVGNDGAPLFVLPGFESALQTFDLNTNKAHGVHAVGVPKHNAAANIESWRNPNRELFHALVLGVRDYCRKTGHTKALLGLSGGIDSALTAVIAAAALGPENVHGVMMPSRYSSPGSIDDSIELAKRLGLKTCDELSIKSLHDEMQKTLEPKLLENYRGITDENVQARLRGVILMAMSNAIPRSLVLATSNKSEIATGYSTLYGDMCGAIAVLGDMTKTRIYELSHWINSAANHAACGYARPPIPESSLTKPPSAELRPNQTDQDTLPEYAVLDQIIDRFIEREQSAQAIIDEAGIDEKLVHKTLGMIDRAQYKRDQAPVVLKVTPRAFGPGRPWPIVQMVTAVSDDASGNQAVESNRVDADAAAPSHRVSSRRKAIDPVT